LLLEKAFHSSSRWCAQLMSFFSSVKKPSSETMSNT